MDYALPRADDLPDFALDSHVTLTKTNPLGVKGVGELGTSGPPAAIGNAILDALWHLGVPPCRDAVHSRARLARNLRRLCVASARVAALRRRLESLLRSPHRRNRRYAGLAVSSRQS